MLTDKSGGTSYVLEYYVRSTFEVKEPTTLAWIEGNGTQGETYTVADELVGVFALGNSLWCKDQGNASICKSEPGENDKDYMSNFRYFMAQEAPESMRSNRSDWDQSNWVELRMPSQALAYDGINKHIKEGTITGTYIDANNYTINVTSTPEYIDGEPYQPNYYCPVNYMCMENSTVPSNVPNSTRTYYFVNPKVQEYALTTFAVWAGDNKFVIPKKVMNPDGNNVNEADLNGAFTVNWENNSFGDKSANMDKSEAYIFHSIIRRPVATGGSNGAPARIIKGTETEGIGKNDIAASTDYEIFPLDLSATTDNIVTAVTTVRADQQTTGDGYYYTITGQRVIHPTPGFYIHNGKKVIIK